MGFARRAITRRSYRTRRSPATRPSRSRTQYRRQPSPRASSSTTSATLSPRSRHRPPFQQRSWGWRRRRQSRRRPAGIDMSYTWRQPFNLGPAYAGSLSDLRLQLEDDLANPVGGIVSTGFRHFGNGSFRWWGP